jgi:hypothetical protein
MTMSPHRAQDFVEIYQAGSPIAAQKIVDVLLAPEGIEVMLHDRMNVVAPADSQTGGVFIAVPAEQREKAVALLDEARENGYLDDEDGERV